MVYSENATDEPIRLEKLQREDLAHIVDWFDLEEFRIFHAPVDERQLEKLLSRRENGLPVDLGYKAVAGDSPKIIGVVHVVVNQQNRFAHVQQIVIGDRNLRRKGYGQRILREVLAICFEELNLHRVQLIVFADNAAARACYEKAGFVREGVMRDNTRCAKGYRSACFYSILEEEWRANAERENIKWKNLKNGWHAKTRLVGRIESPGSIGLPAECHNLNISRFRRD